MNLTAFAFINSLPDDYLSLFRTALPGVEFMTSIDARLPPGLDRAEGVAINWNAPPVDDILAAAPRLRWLHQRGAGVEQMMTARLLASDVVLTNGSGNSAPSIAEHLLGLMLAFARQLPGLVHAQSQRRWAPPLSRNVFELSGQTIAIIGMGAIGRALAPKAASLGMKVVGVRRSLSVELPAGVDLMFPTDQIDSALSIADHVAITLPLTPETSNFFSTERLSAIKVGAYLYNVGRGEIVDQEALLCALRSGHLAGAGLDVTQPEPLPSESALWTEPRVIITAHSSGYTPHSFDRYCKLLLENMRRFASGQSLLNVVDKAVGY